jgi:hypothetical protein
MSFVVPLAVRLVGGHSSRRCRYLKVIKGHYRTGGFK